MRGNLPYKPHGFLRFPRLELHLLISFHCNIYLRQMDNKEINNKYVPRQAECDLI